MDGALQHLKPSSLMLGFGAAGDEPGDAVELLHHAAGLHLGNEPQWWPHMSLGTWILSPLGQGFSFSLA